MNGVATYAKRGTVISADAFPLGNSKLDDQGRCVMTDHGTFVVFNVYVPASGGTTISDKLQFLRALRSAMTKQRQVHQKAVILTGDLNISHGKLDCTWFDQVLHVNEILQQVECVHKQQQSTTRQQEQELPTWKYQLAEAWPVIVETMKTMEAVPTQTQNSKTGDKFNKFRLQVTMENPTRTIPLGKHCSDAGWCSYGYDFGVVSHFLDPESDRVLPSCEANVVCLSILQELMLKIAKIEWTDEVLKGIANSDDAGRPRISPYRQWLSTLLEEDNMVDTFRHLYPTARGRFTCWAQYTNRRYENDGARIDYFIVDHSLVPFLEKGGPLRTGESFSETTSGEPHEGSTNNSTVVDPLTQEAALAAATARGQYKMARFEGGGIADPTQRALDTQFGPRHTGIIYTPPSFSDHVAVSLLLGESNNTTTNISGSRCNWRSENWGNLVLDEKDPSTKKAQPHKVQKSIASFFSSQVGTSSNNKPSCESTVAAAKSKTKIPQKRKATVRSFFRPKVARGCQNETPNAAVSSDQRDETGVQETAHTGRAKSTVTKRKKATAPSILHHFSKK
jgi:exonuclease III